MIPLCVDTFGWWGESAEPIFARIAAAYGQRLAITTALARRIANARLNAVLIRHMARLALINSGASDAAA